MAGPLVIKYATDASQVDQTLQKVDQAHAQLAGKLGATGAAIKGSLVPASSAFGLLKTSMGELGGPFDQLQGKFSEAGAGLEHLKEVWGDMASGAQKAGAVMMGAGAALTAVGAAGAVLGEGLEKAQTSLEVAVKNSGGDFDALKGKISAAQSKMAGFGMSSTDVDNALTKGIQGFGSAQKSLSELGAAADLAASRHESLTQAMTDLVKLSAGSGTRVLAEYGINVKANNSALKDLTKATKDHQAAVDALAKLQQQASDQIVLANAKAQDAEARAGGAAVSAHQSAAKAATSRAASEAKASDAVSAAQLRLQTTEDSLAAKTTQTAADHDRLVAAQNAVANAQKNLSAAQVSGTASAGKLSAATGGVATSHVAAAQAQISAQKQAAALAAAEAKVTETQQELTTATAEGGKQMDFATEQAMLMAKIHGTAAAQAHTFGGELASLKVHVLNAAEGFGAGLGPALTKAGPLIMGVGAILESNLIPTLVSTGAQFVGTGIMAVSTFGSMAAGAIADGASMVASITATAAAWIAENAAMAAASVAAFVAENAATLGIGAAIVGLVAGIVWVATHWKQVWGDIKQWAEDGYNFIKDHLVLITAVFAPFLLPIVEVAKHWGEIWQGIQDAVTAVWQVIAPILHGIGDAVGAITKGISAVTGGVGSVLSHIPGLAEGGVVTSPTLAWVGEAGTEAVIPLDKLGGVGGGSGAAPGGPSSVTLVVDRQVLGQISLDYALETGRYNVTTGIK